MRARWGLVIHAMMLWTTRYQDVAQARLRTSEMEIKPEDFGRLSICRDRVGAV